MPTIPPRSWSCAVRWTESVSWSILCRHSELQFVHVRDDWEPKGGKFSSTAPFVMVFEDTTSNCSLLWSELKSKSSFQSQTGASASNSFSSEPSGLRRSTPNLSEEWCLIQRSSRNSASGAPVLLASCEMKENGGVPRGALFSLGDSGTGISGTLEI